MALHQAWFSLHCITAVSNVRRGGSLKPIVRIYYLYVQQHKKSWKNYRNLRKVYNIQSKQKMPYKKKETTAFKWQAMSWLNKRGKTKNTLRVYRNCSMDDSLYYVEDVLNTIMVMIISFLVSAIIKALMSSLQTVISSQSYHLFSLGK